MLFCVSEAEHPKYNYKQSLNLRLLLFVFTLVYIQYFIRWIRNPISIWRKKERERASKQLKDCVYNYFQTFMLTFWIVSRFEEHSFVGKCLYLPGHWSELDAINFIFLFLFLFTDISGYYSNCWRCLYPTKWLRI